jgi:hypothetical protein
MGAYGVFNRRATEPEWMDSTDFSPALAEQSFRFIELVNRFFGGVRTVQRFIMTEAVRMPLGKTLRILDIGSGSCDIPIAICRWAQKLRINVHFTCIENGRHALNIALKNIHQADWRSSLWTKWRRLLKDEKNRILQSPTYQNNTETVARNADLPITLVPEDIFSHQPAEPYDCAVGSMFFHHLTDKGVLDLINYLQGFVQNRLLINDLHRSLSGYLGCLLLVWPLSAEVSHDALLSIRKSFRVSELQNLLSGMNPVSVQVGTTPIFRIKAVIDFTVSGQHNDTGTY